jgi:glycosyltransferase involved in cell wall biosynthesis
MIELYKSGPKFILSKYLLEFFISNKRNENFNHKNLTEFNHLSLSLEFVYVHINYLNTKIILDDSFLSFIFQPITKTDIQNLGYPARLFGSPKILSAWIEFYSFSRTKNFKFRKKDLLAHFYWLILDFRNNKNILAPNFSFYLYHSNFSAFFDSTFIVNSYNAYYERPLINKISSTQALELVSSCSDLTLRNDIWHIRKANERFTKVYCKINDVDYILLLSHNCISYLVSNKIAVFTSNTEFSINLHFNDTKLFLDFLKCNDDKFTSNKLLSDEFFETFIFSNFKDMNYIFILHNLIFKKTNKNRINQCAIDIMKYATNFFSVNKINTLIYWINKLDFGFYTCSNINSLNNINHVKLFDKTKILNKAPKSFDKDTIAIFGRMSENLGIGEDARMFTNLFNDYSKYKTSSFDSKIHTAKLETESESSLYHLSIIAMPPWDYLIERIRFPLLKNLSTFKIGYWPWELENIPLDNQFIFDDFDFILTPSNFCTSTFRKYTNKPICTLTSPVVIEKNLVCRRNKNIFKFLVMFDANSSIYRKNPFLAIDAFISLYANMKDYLLIIKVMHMNHKSTYEELIKKISKYFNIKLVVEEFSRKQALELIASCDCFISAHRSEGFGRIIAEAMLLNVPTIVSNYSGNLDFCNNDNSYLIDGDMIRVQKGQYGFYKDQYWFNPNLDSLIMQMKKVVTPNSLLLSNAKKTVTQSYSYEATLKKFQAFRKLNGI